MVSHTYQIHLDSDIIRLPNVANLLGKDVEVTIRELISSDTGSNFDALIQLLSSQATADFFSQISDPVQWQKQLRDEWE